MSRTTIPSGSASRGLELIKLMAKLGGKQLSGAGGTAQTQIEQAKVLVEGLSRLKGAAMKLGQTMSVELRDLLPPEVVDALSTLQDQGTALSGAQVREILRAEGVLGELEGFTDAPLASASIGQVHAARHQGRDVVIKVQFPGVAKSVESDIKGLGILVKSFLTLTGRKVQIDPFLEELATVFKQETDYRLEAAFTREYGEKLAALGERSRGFRLPQVVESISNERVLVLSRERGLKPIDWIKLRRPSQEVRNAVAQRFLNLFELEFFGMGLVQTDPNFANFLIDDSTSRTEPVITLLDFGAVKRYDPAFVREYQRLLLLVEAGEVAPILAQCRSLGLLDDREPPEVGELLIDLIRTSIRPFRAEFQPFSFTDADYARDCRDAGLKLTQACQFSPPPRSILFLHRKLGGLFNLAKAMEAKLDLKDYWYRLGHA